MASKVESLASARSGSISTSVARDFVDVADVELERRAMEVIVCRRGCRPSVLTVTWSLGGPPTVAYKEKESKCAFATNMNSLI